MIRSVQASIDGGVVGRLEDATVYFAPLRQLLWDPEEDRVKCHLCDPRSSFPATITCTLDRYGSL